MAETNSTKPREYFTLPFVYSMLADSAEKHDPKTFIKAGQSLDMQPSDDLRTLGWIANAITLLPDDDADTNHLKDAIRLIGGLSSLYSQMLEHQNRAEIVEFIGKQQPERQ